MFQNNPFADLIPQQRTPQAGGPLIPARPRQPAPQTAPQAQLDQYRVQQAPVDIQGATLRNQRTQQEIDNDARARENDRIGRVTALRREFNERPDVRMFMGTRDQLRQIQRLATSTPDNSPGRSQADMALVFALIKSLDPSSTVRESEVASVENTAGVPEQVRNAYNRALRGEGLTPEMRKGMVRAAYDTYVARARSYNEVARQYQPLFQQFGEDPNRHIQIALEPEREAERERLKREQALQRSGGGGNDEIRVGQGMYEGVPVEEWLRLHPEDAPDITTNKDAMYGAAMRREGEPGAGDLMQHGARLGLSDEVAGGANALYNALTAPFMSSRDFDPIGAYQAGNQAYDMRLDRARQNSGAVGTAAEILGGFASGRPSLGGIGAGPGGRTMWNYTPPPNLLGRMGAGARAGAGTGTVAGFGYGEGLEGSAVGAASGAGLGAGLGAALPAIGAGVQRGITSVRNLTGSNPNAARQAIAGAIEGDANTARGVGQQMQQAQANGVPYMLADSGDNARGLLAASTRAPGPARTLARDALEQRQEGLAERVTGAVERDLGPAPNIDEVADQLLGQAQTAAAPLYEAAYARPGAGAIAPKISALLARPSMRGALTRAYRLAAEEGRDPTTLGFALDDAGEAVLTREPSWQTLDYVKRGMDDIVESYRDPTTGRLNLDTNGRAINNTLRTFLNVVDQANPEYAAARAAYAGPVQARSAMEAGRRALLAAPDEIHNVTRNMNSSQLDFYRIGVRRAIVDMIQRRGDSADVVQAIIGTPARRTVLSRLFGGKAEFNRFIQTLQAEREGHRTLRRATQGSPTAQNLQDDAALNSNIPTAMVDMATTGLPITTAIKQGLQFGAARSGNETRQQIAALLSETDPTSLTKLARELMREAARRRAAATAAGRRASAYGRAAGQGAGMVGPPDLR